MSATIPAMTDPLSRYWKQPPLAAIDLSEDRAYMTAEIKAQLAVYDTSYPTGVYPGKMWRCRDWLMWYGPDEGSSCSMGSRKIATVEAAEVNDGE